MHFSPDKPFNDLPDLPPKAELETPVVLKATTRASRALETLVALGVERVLTSGQAATAPEGADGIARLVQQAAGRIAILPGGGVTADNAPALVRATGVTEVHLTGAVPHQSAMTFRAPAVTLGNAAPRSEYEWNVTDAQQIQRVVRGL